MYRSFINSIRNLQAEDFKECVLAISDYALDGIDYQGSNGIVIMFMELVKPQIDANNQRYENGKKGGRPKKKAEEPLAGIEAIPLNDGTEWLPTINEYSEYCRLYPNVDVAQEFRSMRSWSNSNPSRRKTAKGVRRFVNNWLQKEQDKGRKCGGISIPQPTYITNQISGALPKGKPATAETLEAVRKMQEGMKDA